MFTKVWFQSAAERGVKTFLQGYFGFWFLVAGLGDTSAAVPGPDAFDTLFSMDNVKAGVVMLALSVGTSVVTTRLGPDKNSPSVTVIETVPADRVA